MFVLYLRYLVSIDAFVSAFTTIRAICVSSAYQSRCRRSLAVLCALLRFYFAIGESVTPVLETRSL